MSEITRMFVHVVGVETHMGESARGEVYAPRENVKGFVEENVAVKNDGGSQQITSGDAGGETRVYTFLRNAEKFTPKSRVYLPGRSQPAQVFKVRFRTGGTLGTPDHAEVLLV